MPYVSVNDLKLFYETSGDPTDPAVLLVGGLGVQLIDWPDHFVDPLVEAGHFVIRYDNRDIGLSTTFDDAPANPHVVLEAMLSGEEPDVAYTLDDMASDAAGLLDALDVQAAHVVGVSMGGMIAQTAAIRFPAKVHSLTSIMSTTGAADVGQPSPEARAAILSPAAGTDRAAVVAANMASAQIWASPNHYDADRLRRLFEEAWDRVDGPQAANSGRHFCAIVASVPRDEALATLAVPSLVVHGTEDPLIQSSGGERTAALIPGAELMLVQGMGHDLPPAFAPRIVDAIRHLIARTEAA